MACDDSRKHHRLAGAERMQAAKYKLDGVSLTESKLVKAATRGQESGFELPAGSYTLYGSTVQ